MNVAVVDGGRTISHRLTVAVVFVTAAFSAGSAFAESANANAAPAANVCRAAVLDLKPGDGVTLQQARALSEVITSEVASHLDCAVLSRAEIEAIVSFEVSRQQSGCTTESCLVELGEALGVSQLVSGTIQRVDDETLVSLRLVDMATMQVRRRVTDSTHHDEAMIPFVGWLARRLAAGDDAAGPRPVDDTRVVSLQPTVWRQLAWVSVAGAAVSGVLAVGSGIGSLAVQESLPALKSARGADGRQIKSLEGAGPWLAGGANLGLYVGAAFTVGAVGLFLAPAEENVDVSDDTPPRRIERERP